MLIRGTELFRREAIEFQRRRLSGTVALRQEAPLVKVCAAFIIVVGLGAVVFVRTTFTLHAHVKEPCVRSGSALRVSYPQPSSGSTIMSAQIRDASGKIIGNWHSGEPRLKDALLIGTEATRMQPAAKSPCALDVILLARPAVAVAHRLVHGR